MSTLFAFLHHLCAFTLVGALAIEFALIRQELTLTSARRLQVTDLVLGIAAGLLLMIGLSRVFLFEKGPAYYWHSHAFLLKFGLFILLAFVSIIPTMEFLSWRGAIKAGQVPVVAAKKLRRVTGIIHAELAAIVIILLCAAIMARGGWVASLIICSALRAKHEKGTEGSRNLLRRLRAYRRQGTRILGRQ